MKTIEKIDFVNILTSRYQIYVHVHWLLVSHWLDFVHFVEENLKQFYERATNSWRKLDMRSKNLINDNCIDLTNIKKYCTINFVYIYLRLYFVTFVDRSRAKSFKKFGLREK